MIVYNTNPKNSQPIMIVTAWRPNPDGGPALIEETFSISPGQAIDLSIVGLRTAEEEARRVIDFYARLDTGNPTSGEVARNFQKIFGVK